MYDKSHEQDSKGRELGRNGSLTYQFGKAVSQISQDADRVDATFSDGYRRCFDVVVAAYGQSSRTRVLVSHQEASDTTYKSLEVDAAYYSIPRTEDFYAHEVVQVKMKQPYKGCVVLLGDAGYCPSPFTGMGTTGRLISAYVPAGELARHGSNVGTALQNYQALMPTPINKCQKMPGLIPGAFFPSSRLGLWTLHNAMWATSTVQQIARLPSPGPKSGRQLPEYPELKLASSS
ncbi:hypothetical protein JX265_009295 [Neoarthrinium moseri]|uniref:FAD-binding domain-containing protein n=1 Tax=Neoarthrinium moseri TaxID=1658444 RepID=A0A9P9WGC5_9PEZI|nr:hypothetical protein JX265_009295 [Neoarthrinium moseri]